MKTLKKLFSVSAIVALLGTLVPMYAFGANYSDELTEAYAYAYSNGITTMKSIDAADMYGSLTRVAMAKMIANYATTVLWLEPDTSAKCTFTDVTAALDAQYDNWVTKACQLGLMGQNITAFRPNDLVTRAEFGTTLSRALNHDSDDLEAMNAANPYYKDHLNFLKAEGIMNQIDNPSMTEVRGYVMLMMMRADKGYTPNEKCSLEEMVACALAEDTDACLAACTGNEEETPTGNGLVTVKRVWSTTTQEVARNAVNKKVGSIKLTAWEYDTTVNSVVVAHSGLGTAKDVTVQLYMNWVSVSSAKKITKSSAEATLKISPALTIKAGKSETIDIMASLGEDAWSNETHSFTVSAVNVLNWKAEWTPVTLDSIRTTSYEVSTGKVDLTAGVNSLQAWDTNKKLISVKFTPKNNSKLNSFTITKADNDELNLDEVFADVKALYDNKEVGNVSVSKDTISVSNLNIETNKAVTIELKGGSYYVGKSGTVHLNIDADTTNSGFTNDVVAVEVSTNENMRIYNQTATAIAIDVDGVDMTLKNLTTKAQSVATGKSDVELMNLELSTVNEFELSRFTVTADSLTGLEEVYVYVNGSEYDELTSTAQLFKDDTFTVTASKPLNIKVIGSIADTATAWSWYKFGVTINEIKNDNWDKVTVSNVSRTWHTTTVKAGSITIKKTANTPSNKTIKEGEEATLLYFDVKANTDEQTVSTFDILLKGGLTASDLSGFTDELVLMEGNKEIDSIDLTNYTTWTATTLTFENVNKTIAEDETVSYTVKALIKDNEIDNLWEKIQLGIASVDWTEYTITSELPLVKLSNRDAEYTTITVSNESNYDNVLVTNFTVKVARADGLPLDMVNNFVFSWKLVNERNWDPIATAAGTCDKVWSCTFTITTGTVLTWTTNWLANGDSVLLWLDNAIWIESDWYTTEITSVTFKYYDEELWLKPTTAITENYSEKL